MILFDDDARIDLLPFTYTRPAGALRCGILTAAERWEKLQDEPVNYWTVPHLKARWERPDLPGGQRWVNGRLLADENWVARLAELPPQHFTYFENQVLIGHFDPKMLPPDDDGLLSVEKLERLGLSGERVNEAPPLLRHPEDIFLRNRQMIAFDFGLVTRGAPSQGIDDGYTRVYGADNLYVAPGARVQSAIIDAESGPIYIGPQARILPGAIIQGSHAFGEHATVQVGAKLRGDSSFGPWVKVGGEVGNSVIMGYSNKGHDGYLGNSVLGYWCNLGADTNTSNLKNNYDEVRLYSYRTGRFRHTGQQFCGLMMGDHSKCGINTMFNTGTVVGVSANIFGSGFPRNFVPSFAWGGAQGFSTYRLDKACETAEIVMARRNVLFDEMDREVMTSVFEASRAGRRWEKN